MWKSHYKYCSIIPHLSFRRQKSFSFSFWRGQHIVVRWTHLARGCSIDKRFSYGSAQV